MKYKKVTRRFQGDSSPSKVVTVGNDSIIKLISFSSLM